MRDLFFAIGISMISLGFTIIVLDIYYPGR